MPLILGKIIGGVLLFIAGRLVLKVLIALGISVITFTGMNYLLNQVIDYGMSSLSGLPSDVMAIIGLMKVGVCVSMLASAYAARAAIRWSPTDSIKRLVIGNMAT